METMQTLPRIPDVVVKAPVARPTTIHAKTNSHPDEISRLVLENFRKTAGRRIRATY